MSSLVFFSSSFSLFLLLFFCLDVSLPLAHIHLTLFNVPGIYDYITGISTLFSASMLFKGKWIYESLLVIININMGEH